MSEIWAKDPERRRKAGIPDEVRFQTKPQIALEQIRHAVDKEVPGDLVLADAGYGVDGEFRAGLIFLTAAGSQKLSAPQFRVLWDIRIKERC